MDEVKAESTELGTNTADKLLFILGLLQDEDRVTQIRIIKSAVAFFGIDGELEN